MKYNSEQEVFDAVVKHAEQMTKPSVRDGHCLYRSADGNMCLVGALIDDKDYKDVMDKEEDDWGTGIDHIFQRGLLPVYLIPYRLLLEKCQEAHDGNRYDLDLWKGGMIGDLKHIAKTNRLSLEVMISL